MSEIIFVNPCPLNQQNVTSKIFLVIQADLYSFLPPRDWGNDCINTIILQAAPKDSGYNELLLDPATPKEKFLNLMALVEGHNTLYPDTKKKFLEALLSIKNLEYITNAVKTIITRNFQNEVNIITPVNNPFNETQNTSSDATDLDTETVKLPLIPQVLIIICIVLLVATALVYEFFKIPKTDFTTTITTESAIYHTSDVHLNDNITTPDGKENATFQVSPDLMATKETIGGIVSLNPRDIISDELKVSSYREYLLAANSKRPLQWIHIYPLISQAWPMDADILGANSSNIQNLTLEGSLTLYATASILSQTPNLMILNLKNSQNHFCSMKKEDENFFIDRKRNIQLRKLVKIVIDGLDSCAQVFQLLCSCLMELSDSIEIHWHNMSNSPQVRHYKQKLSKCLKASQT